MILFFGGGGRGNRVCSEDDNAHIHQKYIHHLQNASFATPIQNGLPLTANDLKSTSIFSFYSFLGTQNPVQIKKFTTQFPSLRLNFPSPRDLNSC
jgi:hypothetical protein